MRHAGRRSGIGVAAVTLPLDSGAGKIKEGQLPARSRSGFWAYWPSMHSARIEVGLVA